MKQLFFGLFFGLTATFTQAAPTHVHGEARMEISVDREQLVVALEIPLDSLLGFERAPRNASEKEAAQGMATKLKDAGKVLMPSAAAQCTSTSVTLEAPVLGGNSNPGGHNDMDARYTWRCAKPEALRDIVTGLFGDFSKLRLISVEFAGPQGQRAGRLNSQNPRFSW